MIEKSVKIHDRYQFEIKLGYEIKGDQAKTSYNIESYFFIPNNLGINRQTYTKEIFYKDIYGYIRLKTPTLLLRQITEPETSPIINLKESIEALIRKRDRYSREDYEYHLKMLCSIVKSALRDHVTFIKKKTETGIPHLIDEYIAESKKLTQMFRELKPIINVPTTTEKSLAIFRFGDEYLSQQIELFGFKLLKFIDRSHSENLMPLRTSLQKLIKEELDYRVSCNYQSPSYSEKDNEALVYRRGVLKKYIGSALFLSTNREPEGRVLEQIFIGLAAGLAMVFATLVAFFAQKEFGSFTLPVFTALVVSYIFKDRIKELTRIYLVNKLDKFRSDHKTDIYAEGTKKIGVCKEAVTFIEDADLPKKILSIRKRGHFTEVENSWRGEKVIAYRKQVTLFSNRLKNVYKIFNIEGVNDIIRFSVQRFLIKMDNPSRKIYVLDGEKVRMMEGNRVYHVNLILKISREEKAFYKRVRLTLNREGIKRIEEIDLDLN